MTKLYEITKMLKSAEEMITSGEITQEQMRDTLDGIKGEFKEKAEDLGKLLLNLNTANIDIEIKRLQDKKRKAEEQKEWIRNYLKENMENCGITKIDCELFSITCKSPMKKVDIYDIGLIPDDYIKVKVDTSPDKIAIHNAIKDGENVPGAALVLGNTSILIK